MRAFRAQGPIGEDDMISRWINSSLGITLAACLLLPNLSAATNAGDWGTFEVGSEVIHVELKGTVGERRPMDVLLFYPADKQAYREASPAFYHSRLLGVELDPAPRS